MDSVHLFGAAVAGAVVPFALQWYVMSNRHRQRLAHLKERYLRAQQQTEQLLTSCRRQVSDLQKVLELHQTAQSSRPAPKPALPHAASTSRSRHDLDLLLREAEYREDPYVAAVLDFAETRPMPELTARRHERPTAGDAYAHHVRGFGPTLAFGDLGHETVRKADVWAHERAV